MTVVDNFVKGKKTVRGKPVPRVGETVTVVTRDAVAAFLGARDEEQLRRQLRYLRDAGVMIVNEGRLTQVVRAHDRTRFRAHVFRGLPDDVPKIRRRRQRGRGTARVFLA